MKKRTINMKKSLAIAVAAAMMLEEEELEDLVPKIFFINTI